MHSAVQTLHDHLVSGTVTGLRRLLNSSSGNPHWIVEIDGRQIATKLDAQCAYQLDYTWLGCHIEVVLDFANRIVDLRRPPHTGAPPPVLKGHPCCTTPPSAVPPSS